MGLREVADARQRHLANGLRDGADADEHLHAFRDDGRHRAAVDGAHCDDRGIMRIEIAGHNRLQCHDEAGSRDDRIHRLVRNGAMAANALDDDGGNIDRRRDGPGPHHDLAFGLSRNVVEREELVAGEAREEPVLDHLHRPALVFLRRLEDQVNRAVEVLRSAR
jgi:hypothetical protein